MKEPFISVLISEEKLNERIAQLGEQISKDYEGKEVKLICILKGSIIFTCELAKRITVPVKFDFMQVSSYGSGTDDIEEAMRIIIGHHQAVRLRLRRTLMRVLRESM